MEVYDEQKNYPVTCCVLKRDGNVAFCEVTVQRINRGVGLGIEVPKQTVGNACVIDNTHVCRPFYTFYAFPWVGAVLSGHNMHYTGGRYIEHEMCMYDAGLIWD